MASKRSVFREEDFIPGIFNYCDRWCERCAFTLRCRNYAMSADEEGRPIDIHAPGGAERIEENLRKALEMLDDYAEREGLDPDGQHAPDVEEEKEWRVQHDKEVADARAHPLAKETLDYSGTARAWLDAHRTMIDDKVRRLRSGQATRPEGNHLADASEVVHWYVFMIHVKCHRALMGRADMDEDPLRSDAVGSAKVALLGAEASLSAWVTLTEVMPEHLDALLPMLARLQRIIGGIQRAFPQARAFVRPGFDTRAE